MPAVANRPTIFSLLIMRPIADCILCNSFEVATNLSAITDKERETLISKKSRRAPRATDPIKPMEIQCVVKPVALG